MLSVFRHLAAPLAVLAFAALVFSLPARAQEPAATPIKDMPAGIYLSDQTHTSLTFKVSHIGLSNYTARFAKVAAELRLDPQDLTASSVTAVIDPRSVRTDYPNPEEKDFDGKLASDPAWLNAEAHPEIRFVSKKVEVTGDNTGRLHGDLSMLGQTHPVTLDVVFNGAYAKAPFSEKAALGFSATGRFNRADWGFDTYVPMIGDTVEVIIEIEFHHKDAA